MSLYDTAWWVQALGGPPERLDGSAIAKLVLPLLYGADTGAGDTRGMADLERIDLAARLALSLNLDVEVGRVARAVEKLRQGPWYKNSRNDKTWDWSSTTTAVAILA